MSEKITRYAIEGQEDGSYSIERHDFCTKHSRSCKCPLDYVTLAEGLSRDDVAVIIQSAGMALTGESYLY